jgi:pimeloyl-ACP methyl ester carboxylesterase
MDKHSPSSGIRKLWRWIKVPVILYGAMSLFACTVADHVIFQPPPPSYAADAEALIRFETSAGESIAALHFPAPRGRPTLLYSHGNAEDIGHSLPIYRAFEQAGLGVFAYDYPGYGHSEGRPGEAACERAIEAAWNHLTSDLGVQPRDVVIVGRSVGSGPSVWLDARTEPRALVLLSPFKSAFAVMAPAHLIFPGDRFPNKKRLKHSQTPLLVIHGKFDGVIPTSHGRALVDASAAETKNFIEIFGAGHNTLFQEAGPEVVEAIRDFTVETAGPR